MGRGRTRWVGTTRPTGLALQARRLPHRVRQLARAGPGASPAVNELGDPLERSQIEDARCGRSEPAGVVERTELRRVVDVKDLAASIARGQGGPPDELASQATAPTVRIDPRVEEERVVATIPRHVDETDEPIGIEGADVDEAVLQDRLPVAGVGCGLPARPADAEQRVERRIGQGRTRAEVERGHGAEAYSSRVAIDSCFHSSRGFAGRVPRARPDLNDFLKYERDHSIEGRFVITDALLESLKRESAGTDAFAEPSSFLEQKHARSGSVWCLKPL